MQAVSPPNTITNVAEYWRSVKRAVAITAACVMAAVAFPFPTTKYIVGSVLFVLFVSCLATDMGLALAIAAFSIPVQDMTPTAILTLGRGTNIATVVLALLLLAWWRSERTTTLAIEPSPLPLRTPLLMFLGVSLIAIVQTWIAGDRPLSYLLTLFKDQFSTVLFLVIAFRCLQRREQRLVVFAAVIVVDILVALQSVYSYGMGARERSAGLIGGQPNLYGGFLAMQIPFVAALTVARGLTRRVRAVACGGLLLLIQALVLSGSRGAWIAVIIGLLILAIVVNWRVFLLLFVGYLMLPLFFYGFSEERLQSLHGMVNAESSESDQSLEYRKAVWAHVGDLVHFPYVLGRGYATAEDALRELGVSDSPKATHSSYITMAIELGLLGVALYFWTLIGLFRAAVRCARRRSDVLSTVLGAGFVGAIPALAVCDISGSRVYNGEIMAFFWLLGGLLLREAATSASAVGSPAAPPVWTTPAMRRRPITAAAPPA